MSPKTRLRSLSLLIGPIALCGALVPGSSTDARADEPATAAARAVRSLSGAADPAIWRDPADSARSTLIGQRDGSVGVYDLPGNPIQSLRQASLQVDLRDGFVLDGQDETIAALSGGPLQALRFFRIDRASRGLVSLETWSAPPAAVSGSCLYVSPITHETFVFALSPTGTVTQLRVEAVQGRLELLSLRRFEAGEKATVCAADDEMSVVYVAAGKRILRFDAEASVSANFDQAAARSLTSSKSVLGLALYRASDGTGYLLVSQGTDEIAVYRREGDNEPVTTLRIAPDGSGRGELAITGIDVTSASLGSALPKGALVAQDRDQLRILAWDQLASSARPRLKIDAGASAAQGLARASTLPLANRAEQGQTTAADQNQEPNTFKLSEPSGLSTSFSTDGLSEQVDDFNGILFLSYDIPGVGPLRYGSRLDGVFTQQGAPLVSVKNVAGFGLGWELHFGRFLDYSSASGGFRNEFAFEYPNGTRTRQVCDGDPCAYTKMQDGGTIKALGAQYNDGIYQAVSVTTPDGVTYRLDYHVPMLLEAKAWLGVPNTWFGGPDGWYPTRVEDRYGNFTEIAYHGQSAT
ncbi:MAG TPA: phytase, partial [Candidatus Krumholzibacteria bacterium]